LKLPPVTQALLYAHEPALSCRSIELLTIDYRSAKVSDGLGMNIVRFLVIVVIYLMNQLNALGSGIEGQVILRPISPIERPGMVNYRLYQATLTVLDPF
jgi:hypothetical protein